MFPEPDRVFLDTKGLSWELAPDGTGHGLIIHGYQVGPLLEPAAVDLLLRIPAGYPIAGLDMYWVDPPLRRRGDGTFPPSAEHFEEVCGRKWQRFSRHLQGAWKPGVDGLQSYLALIGRELRGVG